MRRAGPVAAAIVLNAVMVAGFTAASVGAGKSATPVGQPPEPMAVTLVLADFIPPPPRPHSPPQASAPTGDSGASISNRKRKSKGQTAPTPEIDASPDAPVAGDATASVAPDGVPEGLRSLLEKPEPCGPTSERNRRSDCSGQYAKLVPPVDDWRLPDLHGYEARFGEVVGVEEKHRRFLQALGMMGKPAGAQDPMGQ